VLVVLIGGANRFEKSIRKKNNKRGEKGAKMLKNRPKLGEKNSIYIVLTEKVLIFAGPKMGKRELKFNKTKD